MEKTPQHGNNQGQGRFQGGPGNRSNRPDQIKRKTEEKAEKLKLAEQDDTVVLTTKSPEIELLAKLLPETDRLIKAVRDQSFSRNSRIKPETSMNYIKELEAIQDSLHSLNNRMAKRVGSFYTPPFEYRLAIGLVKKHKKNQQQPAHNKVTALPERKATPQPGSTAPAEATGTSPAPAVPVAKKVKAAVAIAPVASAVNE